MTEKLTDGGVFHHPVSMPNITVHGRADYIVRFDQDGTVHFNPNMTPDEASAEAWAKLLAIAAQHSASTWSRSATPADDLRAAVVTLPILTKQDPDDAYGVNDVDYIPRKEVLSLIDRAALAQKGDA